MNQTSEQFESTGNRTGSLFLSFLLMAGAFITLFVGLVASYVALLAYFSPVAFGLITGEPEQLNKALAENPLVIFPSNVTLLFCVMGTLLAAFVGYCVASLARFGQMSHAIFLALVTFITVLQLAISKPAAPSWLLMSCMILFPLGIVLGGKIRTRRRD